MKLSKRLSAITQLVNHHYDHIWDTCCDHGQLGIALMAQCPNTQLHFVDIAEPIITKLEQLLKKHAKTDNWQCYTQSVSDLPLDTLPGKHLIIISGVGGDLVTAFIQALYTRFAHLDLEFIVCPVHHAYTLRSHLNKLKFSLINEVLIEENKRFYELIHIANQAKTPAIPVSEIGDMLWQSNCQTEHQIKLKYLQTLIQHYTKASQTKPELTYALMEYQQIYQQLIAQQ